MPGADVRNLMIDAASFLILLALLAALYFFSDPAMGLGGRDYRT